MCPSLNCFRNCVPGNKSLWSRVLFFSVTFGLNVLGSRVYGRTMLEKLMTDKCLLNTWAQLLPLRQGTGTEHAELGAQNRDWWKHCGPRAASAADLSDVNAFLQGQDVTDVFCVHFIFCMKSACLLLEYSWMLFFVDNCKCELTNDKVNKFMSVTGAWWWLVGLLMLHFWGVVIFGKVGGGGGHRFMYLSC